MEKVCCWNSKCRVAASAVWRRGWILRSGRVADLCDSCGSAYEQFRFCETFHSEEDGWKDCNNCKRRLHCGCIASIHLFMLLDGGGIECIDCAKKNDSLNYSSNQIQQPAPFLFSSQTLPDLPVKTCNDSMGARISHYSGSGRGQLKQHPDPQQPSTGQAEISLFQQMTVMDRSNDIDLAEKNKCDELSASKLKKMDKKRSRNLCAKTKRLCMDNKDASELKLTWEEALDLLHPPTNAVPSIMMIEGHEFEEFEEPPMLCKKTVFTVKQSGVQDQWAQCDECGQWRRLPLDVKVPIQWTCADNSWDSKRDSCSTPQEISSAELEELKKQKAAQGLKGQDPSSGLDALASAAVLNENGSIAQTTKHPRHRAGCTCIVCSQPPRGMGPKHKPTCTCNVCLTVKRRFQTLIMRRKKRQSEQDAEKERKRQTLVKEEVEVDSALKVPSNGVTLPMGLNLQAPPMDLNLQAPRKKSRTGKDECSVNKGRFDLNCHPDGEEGLPGGVDRVSMVSLLQDANSPLDMYLQQQGFTGLISPEHASQHVHERILKHSK